MECEKFAYLGKYKLEKFLGKGYNSKVKLAFDTDSSKYYAAKIIKHTDPKLDLKHCRKEMEFLSTLQHPNIVNLIEFHENIDYVKKDGSTYKVVAIIMELVSGGELLGYIANSGMLSEEVVRTYFKILIETVEFFHKHEIAHRDLKLNNLLLDDNFNLKIGDFGFATSFAGKDGELRSWLGTSMYMAPEINAKVPYSGTAVDIFACGVILFVLRTRNHPFKTAYPKDDSYYHALTGGKASLFWESHEHYIDHPKDKGDFFSNDFKELIQGMLALDPKTRYTIDKIKENPWFHGPTVSIENVKEDFTQRKLATELMLQEKLEKAKKQKAMPKKQAQYAQYGVNPYRSRGKTDSDLSLIDETIDSEIDFSKDRDLLEYKPQKSSNPFTGVFVAMDHVFLFKLLCSLSRRKFDRFIVSEKVYKISGLIVGDNSRCNLEIILSRVDENTLHVEFKRKSDDLVMFYEAIENIKEILSNIEPDTE